MMLLARHALVFLVVLSLLCLPALPLRGDVPSEVHAVLMNDLLRRAEVGIEIVRLGSSSQGTKVIFKHNSDIPLIPASNLKLITSSAALDTLGAEFRFRTLLLRRGNDLVLVGDGDPTLGDAELLRKFGWDTTTVFKNWAEGLRKHGITHVDNVLVDDSVFETKFAHPHWPADQLHKRYVAEVAGLNLNANCVDFSLQTAGSGEPVQYATNPPTRYLNIRNTCIGGDNAIWLSRGANSNDVVLRGSCPIGSGIQQTVTVHDPSMFAGMVLAETLEANGVRVGGKIVRDRTARTGFIAFSQAGPTTQPATQLAGQSTTQSAVAPAWQLLAVHETPLPQVLARCNKDSMNLYAESLCKRLGFAVAQESGSWENGTAAVGAFLKRLGVNDSEFHLDDGCGLSKENVVSPNALVQVLCYNYYGKNKAVFAASLSVAGSDGTLEKRFDGTDLRGRVFGKSGFVNNVSSLSGYLHARDDQWYAFSILMNDVPSKSNSSIKPLQEQIVRALDTAAGSGKFVAGN